MKRKPTTVEKYLFFAVMMGNIILFINSHYSRQLLKERMENLQRDNQQSQKIMELLKEKQEFLKERQRFLKENLELRQQLQQQKEGEGQRGDEEKQEGSAMRADCRKFSRLFR